MDRNYLEAARVLRKVLVDKRQSLRSLVFASQIKNKKLLYRLCCETLKYREVLDHILNDSEDTSSLLTDPALVYPSHTTTDQPIKQFCWVILYEYLFGHTLKCRRKLDKAVEFRKVQLVTAKQRLIEKGVLSAEGKLVPGSSLGSTAGGFEGSSCASFQIITIPRYARVNTLKTNIDAILDQLVEEGWERVETSSCNSGGKPTSRKRFCKIVSRLEEHQFCMDKDISELLIFPHGTDLHQHELVENGHLILQDKASCLSAICLAPPPGAHVLDVCAAPGMKTSHLAAIMENKGTIFSIDRNQERVKTMHKLLSRAGVTCSEVEHGDFLRKSAKDLAKVKFALVDPPCSGSGIVSRQDYLTDDIHSKSEARLNSLGNLQAQLLKHAMRMGSLKRVVYATCSVSERENEMVIQEVLNQFQNQFELVHALPGWKHRGIASYDFGSKCLRSSPEKDLTNGFFVAVFEKVVQI